MDRIRHCRKFRHLRQLVHLFNDFVDDSGQSLTEELAKGPAVVSSRYQDYQQMIGEFAYNYSIFPDCRTIR